MKVSQEFSKYAKEYSKFSQIQQKVADELVSSLISKPKNILDLGCGSGAIYNLIDWQLDKFVGVDFSPNMLSLHPKVKNVKCMLGDFNDTELFDNLLKEGFDYIVSASALQWADDLEIVFKNLARFNLPLSLGIFTSKTFDSLNKTAGINSMIPSKEEIIRLVSKYLHVDVRVDNYYLEFETVREMFRYIKKSGVSGGRNILTYKQTRKLMDEYPLNYLEFEVVYINSFSKV